MNETLEHHGILGMKWGVRRYQNKDGTWTKEGKEHRAEESKETDNLDEETKAANKKVQELSQEIMSESDRNRDKKRATEAAITGLNALNTLDAGESWYGNDNDPNDPNDQMWFLYEDNTLGLAQISDLANKGYSEEKINKIIDDGISAFQKSSYHPYGDGAPSDTSGIWLLEEGAGYYTPSYIKACVDYVKSKNNETKHSDNFTEDSLMHYGILGMKWGIRRFQNKDGSLTAAGRKRYGDDIPDGNKSSDNSSDSTPRTPAKSASEMTDQELNQALNRLRMEQQYNELTGAKSSNQYQNQQNFSVPPSNTGNLSNAELQAYINRLDMEKRYKQLTAPPPKELSMGQKFVKEVLPAVAMEVGRELIKNTMKKALGLSGDGGNNNNNNNGGGKNKNNDGGQQKNYDKRFNETNSRIDKLANAVNNLANKSKQEANVVPAKNKNDRNSDDSADNNAMIPASNRSTSNTPHRDSIFTIARNTVRNAQDRWRANEPEREQKRQESREQREKRNASWSAFLTGLERQTGGGINPITKSYETKAQRYFNSYLSDMSKKQYGKGVSIQYLGGTNYNPPALNKRESNSYSTYDSGSEDYSYYNSPWTYRVNRT